MCVPGYVRGLRTVPETRVATGVCGVGRFVCMYVCTYVGMYLAIHTLRIFSTNGHPISAPPPPAMISPFATANPSPRIQRLPHTHTRYTASVARVPTGALCVRAPNKSQSCNAIRFGACSSCGMGGKGKPKGRANDRVHTRANGRRGYGESRG